MRTLASFSTSGGSRRSSLTCSRRESEQRTGRFRFPLVPITHHLGKTLHQRTVGRRSSPFAREYPCPGSYPASIRANWFIRSEPHAHTAEPYRIQLSPPTDTWAESRRLASPRGLPTPTPAGHANIGHYAELYAIQRTLSSTRRSAWAASTLGARPACPAAASNCSATPGSSRARIPIFTTSIDVYVVWADVSSSGGSSVARGSR